MELRLCCSYFTSISRKATTFFFILELDWESTYTLALFNLVVLLWCFSHRHFQLVVKRNQTIFFFGIASLQPKLMLYKACSISLKHRGLVTSNSQYSPEFDDLNQRAWLVTIALQYHNLIKWDFIMVATLQFVIFWKLYHFPENFWFNWHWY